MAEAVARTHRRPPSHRQLAGIKRRELESMQIAGHLAIKHGLNHEETRVVHGLIIDWLFREEGLT